MSDIEQHHVRNVYDQIAPHFSITRSKQWKPVESFLTKLGKGSLVIDVGCGNGKYLGRKDLVMLGCDACVELTRICRRKGFHTTASDNLALGFRDDIADAVISIAVIHHFSTHQRRLEAIQQLIRITKPNGMLMICVWAFEQTGHNKDRFTEQDVYIPWKVPQRYKNPAADKELLRFYHLFKEGELEDMLDSLGGVEIISHGFDSQNWFAVVRKEENE